jgi:hypothetical protein
MRADTVELVEVSGTVFCVHVYLVTLLGNMPTKAGIAATTYAYESEPMVKPTGFREHYRC